jgi:hypothetical protein
MSNEYGPMHRIAKVTSTVEQSVWVVIVDVIILVSLVSPEIHGDCAEKVADEQTLTILGATSILTSMAWLEYKGRASTTRTRLVQSLVLSDLLLG